jgi:hypothetical protein|tara:strand:- start:9654 stop:10241 length:588 start_codon:yes stop_codon:yes gene_type:complete
MADTKVDICARAIIMIGAQPISSFDDGSTEALVASNMYENMLTSLLSRHRWRFATDQRQLDLLTDAPTGRYSFAYQLPDLLVLNTITVSDIPIEYARYGDKVFCDTYGSNSKLIADYTFRQNESEFPAYFKLALEYQLASIFAGSIARDTAMIQQFSALAEQQIRIAKNTDSQEETNKVLNTKRFITNRYNTRGF